MINIDCHNNITTTKNKDIERIYTEMTNPIIIHSSIILDDSTVPSTRYLRTVAIYHAGISIDVTELK